MVERAERIVISYPADLSTWGRDQIDGRVFRTYLRRKLGEVREDDEWEEFVDVGCCGSTYDVPLRVERVTGGSSVDADTAVDYVEREACGVGGGWAVQSAAGPTETEAEPETETERSA